MLIQAILSIILAGFLGTTSMILIMRLIHFLKLATADMERALGSIVTHSTLNAVPIGLLIHYTIGILIAFLYALVVLIAPINAVDPGTSVIRLCVLVGAFHGMVFSMFLVVFVAAHHPLEKYRKVGTQVILAHLVGHLFYAGTVGVVFMMTHLHSQLIAIVSLR